MVLKLTLFKKHFDDILSGKKVEEYRIVKDFWTKRLEFGRKYKAVEFTNGYGNHRPKMIVEITGLELKEIYIDSVSEKVLVYAIQLGKILKTKNIK